MGQELAGVRVLVVEDGPDNQILFQHILAQAGALVELAEDGQQGVEAASCGVFDVILMDIQLPGISGYDATRLLREQGLKTPVIALTAHSLSGERERCIEAGCSEYVTKPIHYKTLIETIHRFVDRE